MSASDRSLMSPRSDWTLNDVGSAQTGAVHAGAWSVLLGTMSLEFVPASVLAFLCLSIVCACVCVRNVDQSAKRIV
jgi:hypothetical protein